MQELNKDDKIIYIEVDDALAVWFKPSQSFLILEEPAFFVLDLYLNGTSFQDIVQQFCEKYHHKQNEVIPFVKDLIFEFNKLLREPKTKSQISDSINPPKIGFKDYFSIRYYKIGELKLKISYGDKGIEFIIHPLISHFEIFKEPQKFKSYQIYKREDLFIFQVNNKITDRFHDSETGYLKAAFLLSLLSELHHVKPEHWMMSLHASAVSHGESALLFSAAAGSGKSTFAALLNANGYNILSDDFLAMNIKNKKIYQLPVAATIKSGAYPILLPYFPELEKLSLEKAYTGKHVRYLPLKGNLNSETGFSANKLVFINYQKGQSFSFKKVSKRKAFQTLLEETWVNPLPNHVKEFFNWFKETQFFEMNYSEFPDALEKVNKLIKA